MNLVQTINGGTMEVLPGVVEPEGELKRGSWMSSTVDHALWLVSRLLLILFIVFVAYFARIPFHRLLERDVVIDMEEAEKAQMLEQYKEILSLSLSAGKFQSAFDDAVNAIVAYQGDPTPSQRSEAEKGIRMATTALDQFREEFGSRQAAIGLQFDESAHDLINVGDDGIREQQDILRQAPHPGVKRFTVMFQAHIDLLSRDLEAIHECEKNYVDSRRE
jgi:hypothetical protein